MEPSDRNLFQSVLKMVDSLSATGNYDTIINILSLLCLLSILNRSPNAGALSGGGSPLSGILGELMKNTAGTTNSGNGANPNTPLAGIFGDLLKGANTANGNTAAPLAGIIGELMKSSTNHTVPTNPLGNILGDLLKGPNGAGNNNTGSNPMALIGILGDLLKGSSSNNNNGSSPLSGLLGSALASPEILMSLLPLLGGLQNKAKPNTSPNIASIMGILNNLGGLNATNNTANNNSAGSTATTKQPTTDVKQTQIENTEKKTPDETITEPTPCTTSQEKTLPSPVLPEVIPFKKEQINEQSETKNANRFLKWKTNF